ncbi:hypothetical protein [Micromonospora tulbaghiae]|uniref:hypothetical protein n=1 Tax=Micromonospora tulbaghiae TaxID=479978 RepID=UPI0034402EA0
MAYKTFSAGDVLTASDVNTYLMRQAVIVCTSSGRPSSPTDGMVIYETDTDKMLQREGSVWRRIPKDVESGGPWSAHQTANDTNGTTTYIPGTSHGVAFTAPPSGKVYVFVSASLATNAVTSTAGAWLSFEVRAGSTVGSGTVALAADDTRAAGPWRPNNPASGYKYAPASARILVTGLTAEGSYNVRTMFRTDDGSATAAVLNRYLTVEPVL